jgi:tetratricopeptide (TPR) repeat protein
MSLRPAIYISAVSCELKSARKLVANTLAFLGYEAEWHDISGTEDGDLRPILRHRIKSCKGLVQLVGECYGAAPPSADERFGRVSYTQYEALYAASIGKKVWYLFLDENFPPDPHENESEEKRSLQTDYRTRVKAAAHLYHPLSSSEGLEASVLKLRDDLTRLRRGVKRWAALVAGLLALSVGLSAWILRSQQHSNEQLQVLQAKFEKLQHGVNTFAEVQNKVLQEQPGQKPDELERRTYDELGKELGLDSALLKEELPRFAQELRKTPNATAYERANAAYIDKDYAEAERWALAAADEAQRASPPRNAEAIKDLELAGWAAEKRIEYADALKHLREAEKLTDRSRDPLQWASVQYAIAFILYRQGQYANDEMILREVLVERERALGKEHPDTLRARNSLAIALRRQGQSAAAEAAFRDLITLEEKVLGPKHPDTLRTRNNLANVLNDQGKYSEAEAEFREVIRLREKVLGPEHPDTLTTRNNFGIALDQQGKYPEAAAEFRALIKLREKVLGPEHRDTLQARNNLGLVLYDQGKYADAEAEFRTVIKLNEKVLGPEHPDTLDTRNNLALALGAQGKYADAETEGRTVIKLREKVLGPERPETLGTRSDLVNTLLSQGKYAEAEAEARAVIELEEKGSGAEHPNTLETRSNFAKALAQQGKYAEAEAEDRAVLQLREKVLGVEHPFTLKTCFDLAVCLRSEGKFEEAKAFARRAADTAQKVLGPEHPDTKKYEQLRQELVAKNG